MADISHIKGPDNTSYDIKDATARSDISNLARVASTGEYSDLLHPPTVAEIDDSSTAADKAWSAQKINSFGGSFVSIAGNETITGDKDFEGDVTLSKTGNYGSKSLNIKSFYNKSDAPQAADKAIGIKLLTRDDGILTFLSSNINGNGNTVTYLGNNGYDSNGNIVSAQDLILYSNRDGSHSVSVRHPEDWRSALSLSTVASSGSYNDLSDKPTIPDAQVQSNWNETDTSSKAYIQNKPSIPVGSDYVLKAGDTMTGSLTAPGLISTHATSPTITSKATSIDASKANNNVSSNAWPGWNAQDSAGRILTRMEGVISPSGPISAYWYVRNYNTSGTQVGQKGITMSMAKDGTLTYTVDDKAKFCDALGLASVATSGSYNDLSNKPSAVKQYNGTITTDSGGFFNVSMSSKFKVLSAWANQSDTIVIPFSRGSTDNTDGNTLWWFKVLNDQMVTQANSTKGIHFLYI